MKGLKAGWKRIRRGLCLGIFWAVATCHTQAMADLPAVQNYAGVNYLTGGFGLEESTAIKEAMSDYAVAFTFASSDGSRAAYVSQVQVVIRDTHDATWLNVESQGPFLLAQLPAGRYQVFATYRNVTKSQSITVADGSTARVVFDWPRPASQPAQPADKPSEAAKDSEAADPEWTFPPGSIPGLH